MNELLSQREVVTIVR